MKRGEFRLLLLRLYSAKYKRDTAVDAVFAQASSPHERFNTILERLTPEHASVKAYREASAGWDAVMREVQSVYGAASITYMYEVYLQRDARVSLDYDAWKEKQKKVQHG